MYASRAPDMFFGGHHFHNYQQAVDQDVLGRNQAQSAFIQHPNPQQAYYGDQSRFQYGDPHSSQSEYPQQTHQYGMPGVDELAQQPQHGHTSTIKALKRKLQENFISSCKPSKIARVIADDNPDVGFHDFTNSDQTNYVMNVNVFRNNQGVGDVRTSGNGVDVYGGETLPAMYQSAVICPVQAIRQKKAMLVGAPAVVQKLAPTCTLEQVVPEITIPDCYLTPDQSPANSPKPQGVTTTEMKQETQEIKQLTTYVMSRLKELKQTQTISETPVVKQANCVPPNKKKNLPIIDAIFVDSFFDDLQPAQQMETSFDIKVEPLSPEPAVQVTTDEHLNQSLISTPHQLLMMSKSSSVLRQPLLQPVCNIKEELTMEECTDLEELLGLVDTAGPDANMMSPTYSTDSISPAASPRSYTCSVTESSPISSTFGSNSCLKQQHSLDRRYTDMSPGSSPGYDGRDDILESDSWLLEPISVPLDMSLVDTIESTPCDLEPFTKESELYHLKKLLQQSWEPCGKNKILLTAP